MTMTKKWKTPWLEALRSDNYDQGKGLLKAGNQYCCLGVLCEVMGEKATATSYLERLHSKRAGLSKKIQIELANMNDGENSFNQIADWIEDNL